MEFLDKLFEYEYFIYILIGILAVLVILFVVVLLSGRKKKNLAEATVEKVATETNPPIELTPQSLTEAKQETLDQTKEFKAEDLQAFGEPIVSANQSMVEESAPAIQEETVVETNPQFVATPIVEPVIDQVTPIASTPIVEPVVEPVIVETPIEPANAFPTPVIEEPIVEPAVNNTQFSSVYLEEETPIKPVEATPIFETPAPIVEEPTPVVETAVPLEESIVAEPVAEQKPSLFTIKDDDVELPKLNNGQ